MNGVLAINSPFPLSYSKVIFGGNCGSSTPLRFSCRFTLNRVCLLNILINEPISKRGIPTQKLDGYTQISMVSGQLRHILPDPAPKYLGMGHINRQAMKPPSPALLSSEFLILLHIFAAFPPVWWSHLRAVMSADPTKKIIYCSKTSSGDLRTWSVQKHRGSVMIFRHQNQNPHFGCLKKHSIEKYVLI